MVLMGVKELLMVRHEAGKVGCGVGRCVIAVVAELKKKDTDGHKVVCVTDMGQ
jgi:hypothetical protein